MARHADVGKTRPKVKAMLRTKPLYSLADLIRQYKARVLPFFENTFVAFFHAYNIHLIKLEFHKYLTTHIGTLEMHLETIGTPQRRIGTPEINLDVRLEIHKRSSTAYWNCSERHIRIPGMFENE